ncbi:MAG: hypothetical protein IPF98_22585 [Gemmatimonadetes bacterium]|nr:hypothetical protein [Gemmatimonadota bacterium]
MSAQRLLRIASASAIAGASWLLLAYLVADAFRTDQAVLLVTCTLGAMAAVTWLLGILFERDAGSSDRAGGNRSLRAQAAVTRALRAMRGNAARADLFALIA